MADELHEGDHVTWKSHGSTVTASKDEPQYGVRSDKSGRTAAHEPGALHED